MGGTESTLAGGDHMEGGKRNAAEILPWMIASREMGPQSYHHKALSSANNLSGLRSRIFPGDAREERSPASTIRDH